MEIIAQVYLVPSSYCIENIVFHLKITSFIAKSHAEI